jgi:hypothetical protein
MAKSEEPIAILGYGGGFVGADELNSEADKAWREMLADPRTREQAAKLLDVTPGDLAKKLPASPFEFKTNEAGLGPVELGLIVFAGNVAYDLAKEVARTALKTALVEIWRKLIKPRIESQLPLGALGNEADVGDPGDKRT